MANPRPYSSNRHAAKRPKRPKWAKPVALASAAAVALTGLVAVQSFTTARDSEAVAYLGAFDGTLDRTQLWMVGTGAAYDEPEYIANPSAYTSANFVAAVTAGYDKEATTNGADCDDNWENLAMGPILEAQGDHTIAHLGWNSNGGAGAVVFSGDGNCYEVSDLTPTPNTGGWFNTTWGGEVNQKTGEIYLINDAFENFDGDSATNDPQFNIIQVVDSDTGPAYNLTINRLAVSSATPPAQGAQNLAQAAQAAGKSGNVAGNWRLGSDMAIDANGNAYRMARFDATGANDYWALIRFNIPRGSTGQPLSAGWTYNVVKVFDNAATDDVWGMSFLDGYLYTAHADDSIYRWDPLAGSVEDLGEPFNLLDLAAAQMAPVIEGSVYNDLDGDGQIETGEPGLGGVAIEVWQSKGANAPQLRGTLTTDSDGSYSALLPSSSDEFYLRVQPTRIGGVNAAQSHASAGKFSHNGGALNVVTALCAQAAGNYREQSATGACRGARQDGIDPATPTNPIAPAGGANTVTKIDMNSDLAVVTADFGLTAARSWGDAPDTLKTTAGAGGPSAVSEFLHLGPTGGRHPNGQPGVDAAAHNTTDDGVLIQPFVPSQLAQFDWRPLQDRILVAGQGYRFLIWPEGPLVVEATAKVWHTPLSGGVASSAFSAELANHTFDEKVNRLAAFQMPAAAPAGPVASAYVRARIDRRADVSAQADTLTDQSAQAWAGVGEVEDYRIGVANAVVRVGAKTAGNVPAHVYASLTNVSDQTPSSTGGHALTGADGSVGWFAQDHAVVDPSGAVT
ncbi:MAG: hypothetical protein LBO20_07115, partial [Bifidobacteriaceae bacterium]|nr:hypothetical protein [Bifidobacteriaceae bacterium]